jgi:hypothetical protein
MSVIPPTQLSLMRKRRQLKTLMESGHWNELLDIEVDLFTEIDTAVNDPQRSSKELLKELASVIRVYRELSDLCYIHGQSFQHPQQ